MSEATCTICEKHPRLEEVAGAPIAIRNGLMLSHFPHSEEASPTLGHLLLEPLRHIEDLSELNEDEASALGELIVRASAFIRQTLGAEHVYLFRINDKVAHLHFHLVPRYPGTPKEHWGLQIMNYADSPKASLMETRKVSLEMARAFEKAPT